MVVKFVGSLLCFGRISSFSYLNTVCWFQVLIWDVETQPNRHAVLGAATSRPDLVCPLLRYIVANHCLRFILFFFPLNLIYLISS